LCEGKIIDLEADYAVTKSIVQSGQSDERKEKGIWPMEKEIWKQYRKYFVDKLVEMMEFCNALPLFCL